MNSFAVLEIESFTKKFVNTKNPRKKYQEPYPQNIILKYPKYCIIDVIIMILILLPLINKALSILKVKNHSRCHINYTKSSQ